MKYICADFSKHKRKLSLIILFLYFVSLFGAQINAEDLKLSEKFKVYRNQYTPEEFSTSKEEKYMVTKEKYVKNKYVVQKLDTISVAATQNIQSDNGNIPTLQNYKGNTGESLKFTENNKWFEWEINVPQAGLYEIALEYYIDAGDYANPVRKLYVDGVVPFAEANNLMFYRSWKDKSSQSTFDNNGDEIKPVQVEIANWKTTPLRDNNGIYSSPFMFYFEGGSHKIKLEYMNMPLIIRSISLKTPENPLSYRELYDTYQKNNYKPATKSINFQAESNIVEKNDSIVRKDSSNDPISEPNSDSKKLLNVIGGTTWSRGNQFITWKFHVDEDGLYKIGFRDVQWFGIGLPSYRRIEIDKTVPFKELLSYGINFSNDWKMDVFQDNKGNPYEFYLNSGDHEITMTVNLEPIAGVLYSMNDDLSIISDTYRKIIMITGSDPDPNYIYELDRKIPKLVETLNKISTSIKEKADYLVTISQKNQAASSALYSLADQFKKMAKNPDNITRQLADFLNAQGTLGSWYQDLQQMPLMIDYFSIIPPKSSFKNAQANFLEKISTFFKQFFYSFTKDYSNVGSTQNIKNQNRTIDVWVAMGSEWAEVLKENAAESFTPKTGIGVRFNILPVNTLTSNDSGVNVLILAVNAGKGPDVASGVLAGTPVDFAIRKGAADLTKFSDYKEVTKRFLPKIMTPFKYNNGEFALPETMNFTALFYRKDILNELKLSIPKTFSELYDTTLPALVQNNMQFYIPTDFTTFLLQNGGQYYTDDGYRSKLDSKEAYKAFKEMCEIFTTYGVPIQADLFNRMRSGEIPIGIGSFADYIRLSVAAPELIGKWGIAPVPGHLKTDGTIDRSVSGVANNAIMILNDSKKKSDSWEFLKWWTSTEIQRKFGNEIERQIGTEARWPSANLEAFTSLPWKDNDLNIIKSQWEWAKEIPVVIGGYYTGRHVTFAFNRVVVNHMPVRDSLEKAVSDINKELIKKQEEYKIKVPDKYSK